MIQYFVNKENDAYFACLHTSNDGWSNTYVAKFRYPFNLDEEDIELVWGNTEYEEKGRHEISLFMVNSQTAYIDKLFGWKPIEKEVIDAVFTEQDLINLSNLINTYIKYKQGIKQ